MSEYSKGVALILATVFGPLGIDKFYVGATGLGVAQLIATILVIGLIWSGPYAFISILTLVLAILFGMNTFFYPEVNWSTKNPSFDKGVAIVVIALVLMMMLSPLITSKKDEIERFPVQTLEEDYEGAGINPSSTIICKNVRNLDYKNLILSIADAYSDKKVFEGTNRKNFVYKIKGSDIIYQTEEEIQNYIVSNMQKLRRFVETLENKFNNNVNYIHFYSIIREYLKGIMKSRINKNLTEDEKEKIITNYTPQVEYMFSDNLFGIYINNKADWNEELITYKDDKFNFYQGDKKINLMDRIPGKEDVNFAGKSKTEIIRIMLELSIKQQDLIYESDKMIGMVFPNIDDFINNEEFINTFDGSNSECSSFLKDGQEIKYADNFKVVYFNPNSVS